MSGTSGTNKKLKRKRQQKTASNYYQPTLISIIWSEIHSQPRKCQANPSQAVALVKLLHIIYFWSFSEPTADVCGPSNKFEVGPLRLKSHTYYSPSWSLWIGFRHALQKSVWTSRWQIGDLTCGTNSVLFLILRMTDKLITKNTQNKQKVNSQHFKYTLNIVFRFHLIP